MPQEISIGGATYESTKIQINLIDTALNDEITKKMEGYIGNS